MEISFHNAENQQDRQTGLSYRLRVQISRDVLWSVFENVTQSNARYQGLDTLTFHVFSFGMPVGSGKKAESSKGRPISTMSHIKRRIMEVKAKENCVEHALVIAVVRVTNDLIFRPTGMGERRSCPRFVSCCKRRTLISIEWEGFPNYKPFSAICHSIE